ncbi:MAG: hypothetical protein ACSW8I_02555 [bacterium]
MGNEFYNYENLLNVHTKETQTWTGRFAKVTHMDGSIIEGVIKEVGYAANRNRDNGIVEHLWVNLLIGDTRVPVTKIKILEIKK